MKKKKKSTSRKYRFGPSKSRPGAMMLVVEKDKKRHVHCGCGREHGVLDEIKDSVMFSVGNRTTFIAIERHDHPVNPNDIMRIVKIACVCGMRARFSGISCAEPESCSACGQCIKCRCCACRDTNPFGSYR